MLLKNSFKLAILIAFSYQLSPSQTSIGFSGGINSSKLISDQNSLSFFKSSHKTGYCFGIYVSKKIENFLNIDGELLYDHKVSYAEFNSGGLAFGYHQKGSYYINSYNLVFYPSLNIPATNIFINPGLILGYLSGSVDGEEDSYSVVMEYPGYSNRAIKKSIFYGTDIGVNIGLMYKKEIINKLQIFTMADYRRSLKYYPYYDLSFNSWLFRLGLLMKISEK